MNKLCKKFFPFYIVICPILFLLSLFIYSVNNELNTLLVGFFLVYVITVTTSVISFGFFSLYSIFLYTSAFFIYDCFFFTLFSDRNFLIQTFPRMYSFDNNIGFIFIISSFLSVYTIHIGYCLLYYNKNIIKQSDEDNYNIPILEKIGIIIMLIFLVPVLYKIYLQVRYVMSHGYVILYTKGFADLSYPFWTAGSYLMFNAGYIFLLASSPSKKKYIIFSVLYVMVYLANAMKGGRGQIISIILILLYLYQKKYKSKIQIHKILGLFGILMILIVSIGTLRDSYGKNINKNNNPTVISEIIEKTLWVQTTSRAVPLLIMNGDLKYHDFPFFFYHITKPFLTFKYKAKGGDNIIGLQKYNNPSQVLMANISLEASLSGNGYGTAFLGESYEFGGYFGIIFFSIIISFILVFFDKSPLSFKPIYVPIIFYFLLTIPCLPRDSLLAFLDSLNFVIFSIVLLLFIDLIIGYINPRGKKRCL